MQGVKTTVSVPVLAPTPGSVLSGDSGTAGGNSKDGTLPIGLTQK